MKKKFLIALSILMLSSACLTASAAKFTANGKMAKAIKKYKNGNYTGCLQDAMDITKKDPSNAIAYYYMAIAYVQAGKKDEAIEAYDNVISLKPNITLYKYAAEGKKCLEYPSQCTDSGLSELDKIINDPMGENALSTKVQDKLEGNKLQSIKNKINNGEEINRFELDKFEKFKSENETPSNDEIVAALRVLQKAGLSPYSNQMNSMIGASPQMNQLSLLMGNNNSNQQNNSMMNMLPFLMTQNKPGEKSATSSFSPQIMEAMLMNSMMPDFTIDTDKK